MVNFIQLSFALAVSAAPAQHQASTLPIFRVYDSAKTTLENHLTGLHHTVNKVSKGKHHKRANSQLTNLAGNMLYSAQTTLGNGQTLTADLDTGSSDIWFKSSHCSSTDNSCQFGKKIDTSDSTFTPLNKQFKIKYVDLSEADCDIYSGPVTLAGLTVNVPFGAATALSKFNSGSDTDGLFGMGFNGESQISAALRGKQSANFFDLLKLPKSQNLFSFYLSNNADGDFGQVTLGGVDNSKFTGSISYFPLVSSKEWAFSIDGLTYAVGNNQPQSASQSVSQAIPDTGTSLLMVEQSVADSINSDLGAQYDSQQQVYIIDCSAAQSGQPLTFNLGSSSFSIPASVYVVNAGTDSNGQQQCISGIVGGADGSTPVLFGDVFIRSVYTIFDKGNKRVGFAQAVHPN
ncbi:hypothetical protein HDV01_004392 [Terramyces sp. JEL0728]|nr:hypothetical protein HDV01_004392 [Terramyces sp. JEL0728]